jgi:hypothetical protein
VNLTANASTRFRARWPSGAVDRHALPLSVAARFASELRPLGVTVAWYPIEPARPSKSERRLARRQMAEATG